MGRMRPKSPRGKTSNHIHYIPRKSVKLVDNTPTRERVTVFHIAVDSRLGHRQRLRYNKVFLDDLHDRLKWGNHDVISGGPFIAIAS